MLLVAILFFVCACTRTIFACLTQSYAIMRVMSATCGKRYRYDPYERLSSAPLPDHWVTQIYQDALTGLAFPWYIDSETGHKQWFFPSDDEMHANAKQNGKNGKNGGKGGNNQGENQATGADSASSKPASLKLVPSKIKLVRKGSDKGILDGGDEEAGSSKSGSTSAKSARSNSRGKARVKRASSVREDQGKASKTRNNSTPGRKTPGSTRTRTPSVDARGVQRRNSSISGSGTPLSEKTRRTLQSLEAAELQQQLIDSKAAFEKEIKSLKQQMAVERSTARTKLTNLKSKCVQAVSRMIDNCDERRLRFSPPTFCFMRGVFGAGMRLS